MPNAELLNIFMTKLEEHPLGRNEDTFRTVSTLHLLLQCFQGDMHPYFREDMIAFFSAVLPKLNDLRWATTFAASASRMASQCHQSQARQLHLQYWQLHALRYGKG